MKYELLELRAIVAAENILRKRHGVAPVNVDATGQPWGLEYRITETNAITGDDDTLVRGSKSQVLLWAKHNLATPEPTEGD